MHTPTLPDARSTQGAAPRPFNIAQFLPRMAEQAPERRAIICTQRPDLFGRTALTFRELDAESDRLAWGLREAGVESGSRTLLMLRPGLDFLALTFALFKLGAVPVLIDPGMGVKNWLNCVRQCSPRNMIAIPLAHALRILPGNDAFGSVALNITAGRRWWWGGLTLRHIRGLGSDKKFPMAQTTSTSPAAILFTSGGTGTPKGVLYEHGMFGAQVELIRDFYGIEPGERDLPAFPLFGLFAAALGTSCVIPDMDPSHPAQCDPEKIVRGLQANNITYTFGSPSIWKRVGPYCAQRGITLPLVKRILMAGAPVRAEVLAPFAKILPHGDTFIPYGATEALPVANIRGSEVLNETWPLTQQGRGYCVGRPLPGITVKIVSSALTAAGQQFWNDNLVLPANAVGEIVVKGPVVTKEYFNLPQQTAAAKIYEPLSSNTQSSPSIWHRMGDMGYFDDSGRLWFCGRKAHRVILRSGKALYSVCIEAVFENFLTPRMNKAHPAPATGAVRAALAGIGSSGAQEGVIVVELPQVKTPYDFPALIRELNDWSATERLAADIAGILWYRKAFPVDVRHNAKIDREALSRWAGAQRSLHWINPNYSSSASNPT